MEGEKISCEVVRDRHRREEISCEGVRDRNGRGKDFL